MLRVVHFFESINNPVGLTKFVIGKIANNFFALAQVGPQIFWFPINVVGDNSICSIQNRLCAAIVLCQHHCCYFRKRIFKLHDVAKVSTAEAIHALVCVTDNTHVVVQCAQQQHNLVLRHVGVLILVNQNVLKTLLVRAQHVGVLAKQSHRIGQQIVKVHCTGAL